jgi:hypothetical protein
VRCSAITSGGERCKLEATHGSYCWSHAPEKADERRRRGRRGGKAGGRGRSGYSSELTEIKGLLKDLTDRVTFVEGSEYLPANHAAVAAQLINTRLRAVELERKLKETEELEDRMERLEQIQEQKGGGRWRA